MARVLSFVQQSYVLRTGVQFVDFLSLCAGKGMFRQPSILIWDAFHAKLSFLSLLQATHSAALSLLTPMHLFQPLSISY